MALSRVYWAERGREDDDPSNDLRLSEPGGGELLIDGLDVAKDPLAAQARIGVLPDMHGLYPRLTSREHARYAGGCNGLNGAKLEQRIDCLIETLDMGAIADRRVSGFSHGERSKVSLARALVHHPRNVCLTSPRTGWT